MNSTLYDQDFYAWANKQARLLRAGRLSEADIEHIAEEIESMGKAEKRELASRLSTLLLHLLKWRFQPKRRGSSWEATIKIQRLDLRDHLTDSPSLKAMLPDAVAHAYRKAVIAAADETGLPESIFPEDCPWSSDQILAQDFWPDEGP